MCRVATNRALVPLAAALVLASSPARAQQAGLEWRHLGNSAIEMALPSVATGPLDRVWYAPDGSQLYVRTNSGRVFATEDFEQWKLVTGVTPPAVSDPAAIASLPEATL